jgi:hypothetical protein
VRIDAHVLASDCLHLAGLNRTGARTELLLDEFHAGAAFCTCALLVTRCVTGSVGRGVFSRTVRCQDATDFVSVVRLAASFDGHHTTGATLGSEPYVRHSVNGEIRVLHVSEGPNNCFFYFFAGWGRHDRRLSGSCRPTSLERCRARAPTE